MAKKAIKKLVRREYTKEDVKELRAHSKAQTPLEEISRIMERTGGSLRQKAIKLGIPLGHRRRKAKSAAGAKGAAVGKKAKAAAPAKKVTAAKKPGASKPVASKAVASKASKAKAAAPKAVKSKVAPKAAKAKAAPKAAKSKAAKPAAKKAKK